MRLCYGFCLVIGALLLINVAWGLNANCFASGSSEGTCVPAEQCSTFKELLEEHGSMSQALHGLRAAQSGCRHENSRHVCCANKDIIDGRTSKREVRAVKGISPECLQDRLGDGHRHNGTFPSESSFIVYVRHVVLLNNSSVYGICGGSLITSEYVLTAAHCAKDKEFFDIYIGSTNLNYTHEDGNYPDGLYQELEKDDAIIHEEYNETTHVRDIALLRLRQPIDFTLPNSPKPVCIPSVRYYEAYLSEYPILITYGWGENIEGVSTEIKQTTYLQYLPLNYCKGMMKELILQHRFVLDEGNICTRTISGHNAFRGYSGSPLMFRQTKVWFMLGLISFGIREKGLSSNKHPLASTSIAYNGDWIIEKIKQSQR
ncbi:serine protease 42-like [Anopheles darlingi]|uniref:serine protease 42-like n=1 Tax=Anopheles darlingi TaxID=43151 RepID=UPI0021002CE8|nr:serine protease 42-like [Anopheles darlingi]